MNPTFMKMFYKDIEEMGISKTYSQQTNRGKQSNNYDTINNKQPKRRRRRRPPMRPPIGMYDRKPMRQYQQQVYQAPPICQQQVYQPQIYEQEQIYEQQQMYQQEVYQPQVYQQQQMQQTQEVTCFGCGAIGHWARDCPSIQPQVIPDIDYNKIHYIGYGSVKEHQEPIA
eukprot:1026427_1